MADDTSIAVIGQAAFGESVLNALADNGFNVTAAFCPLDREGGSPDPLKTAAQERNIAVFQFGRLRDTEAVDTFHRLEVGLCVMAFVTDIVPEAILEAPANGTIQYHPSLLPKHRGPSSINWPIIQGEKKTGLSIFWPDKGLDTGPILLQKEVEIGPDDTLGSVYFDRLFPMGVDAMVEAVDMVIKGTAPRMPQDESQATYEGWCRAKDVVIDWSQPVADIYNLIRGSDPSPGAGTTLNGERIQIYRGELGGGETGKPPGEVTEVTEDGFTVAASGGSIVVRRVKPAGGRKVKATEWTEAVSLEVGASLGT